MPGCWHYQISDPQGDCTEGEEGSMTRRPGGRVISREEGPSTYSTLCLWQVLWYLRHKYGPCVVLKAGSTGTRPRPRLRPKMVWVPQYLLCVVPDTLRRDQSQVQGSLGILI